MACNRCGAPTRGRLCRQCELDELYGGPVDGAADGDDGEDGDDETMDDARRAEITVLDIWQTSIRDWAERPGPWARPRGVADD